MILRIKIIENSLTKTFSSLKSAFPILALLFVALGCAFSDDPTPVPVSSAPPSSDYLVYTAPAYNITLSAGDNVPGTGLKYIVEDEIVASSYFPELPLSIIDGETSGYRLETGGEARIAGHTARRVTISPEDSFRYGYDFWLEEQTGLLLKWELFDTNHKPLAKLMFTDFAIGTSVNLEELESDSRAEDFVEMKTFSLQNTVVTGSSPRWHPARLPPGFELTSHNHKTGADGVYEHMVYSDGLAAVSVYVEQQDIEAEIKPGISQLGTNNAYTTKQGALQITVIGEVPAITVKTIANEMALSVASN